MSATKAGMLFVLSFVMVGGLFAADAPPALPESVLAALSELPPELRPQETKVARNGAIYLLLQNGAEIIVKEKRNAPVVSVQAWVRTGAIDEGKWMGAGLSHFCEHMLFKGTTKRPTGVLDQEIRGAGGDDNAYTTSERTVYHVTSQADGFDTAFNAIADMIMDSTFPPEETTKEHGVVYKEIERFLDNADGVLWETMERTVYQNHPYRVPVLGYPDVFKRVTREDVFAYYQERYTPHLTTFLCVGDFDSATVLPKMIKVVAPWKRKTIRPTSVADEPEQVAPRHVDITHPLCEVPKLAMAFPSVSLRNPDLYALDLLASILGDGRPSRLYRTVKDKEGLVSEISAMDYTPMYQGYFAILATLEGDKIEPARDAIMKVLEEAKTKKPTEEELARAKRKIYTQHIMGQMTADGLAERIGSDWFVAGDMDFSELYTERMQNVTADDIVRVAKKYLVPEKLTFVVMRPEPKPEKNAQAKPTEKAEDKKALLAKELEQVKAHPSVAKAELIPEYSVFEITLKNGVRAIVRQDHSLPVANIAVAALGGSRWEPAELAGAGNLLSEMLDRGTAKRDKYKMAEEAEALGASLETFSGRNSFGMAAAGLSQDLPKLLDLAADAMLHPKFPADEFEKLKVETLQRIAQEDESLFTLNSKVLRPLLYGDHPYARQTIGTPETVKKATPEDLKKLHQAWVHPENLAVSFVGDVSAIQAVQLASQYFGELKTGKFQAPAVPAVPQLTGGKSQTAEKPNITGAILTLGFRGVDIKSPDREKLDLISSVLSGLGGRLNVALREKQGLAYAIGVQNDSQLDGGAIVFFIQTDEKSLEKALTGMWDEVKKLRTELVPDKELQTVKNYMSGTEAIELQNQGQLAQRLALSQLYNEGAAEVFLRKQKIEKVTADDIKAAANKYLDPDKFAKAILKPK